MIVGNAEIIQNNSRETVRTIDLSGAYASQLAASAAVNKFAREGRIKNARWGSSCL